MTAKNDTATARVEADRKTTYKLAEKRDAPLVKATGFLAEVADQPQLIATSIGTLVIGLIARRPDLTRGGARMLAAHFAATMAKSAIKHSVDRTRPAPAIEKGRARFEPGNSEDHEETSFPSGHTAGAVAVAGALAKDAPVVGATAYALAGGVAAMQLPRGKHYLLDTIAGAAVGFVAQRAASAAVRVAERTIVRAVQRRT